MTREELDALLVSAVTAMAEGATDPEAVTEAQLLDAEARAFADAVDRNAKRIPYGSAVMLEGANGVAVVTAADYEATPGYWRTVVGRVDRIVFGPELIQALQRAANRAAPSGT